MLSERNGSDTMNQRTPPDLTTRLVEFMFYRQKEIERAIRQARESTRSGHSGGSCGHAFVSDPTAIEGIRLATELKQVTLYDGVVVRHPERWMRVVRGVYDKLDDLEKRVIRRKYSNEDYKTTMTELNIDTNTYYHIVNRARTLSKMAACQLGLIKVIE